MSHHGDLRHELTAHALVKLCSGLWQADFAVTQKDLDFSHMRDHMRRILAGQSRLFSLGSDNAVVQLVSRGGPRVLESQVCARLVRYFWSLPSDSTGADSPQSSTWHPVYGSISLV